MFYSQLKRDNPFYAFEPPPAMPELDEDWDENVLLEDVPCVDGPMLCAVCGVRGPKACARCKGVGYCSKAHQVTDVINHTQ